MGDYDDDGPQEIDYNDLEEEEEDEEGEDEDEDIVETRHRVSRIIGDNRKFLPRMTSYEWSRANETRASQIENGSSVGIEIPPDITDALDISNLELREKKCPLLLGRPTGDNSQIEVWHTNELDYIDVGLKTMMETPIQLISRLTIDEMLNFGGVLPNLRKFAEKQKGCEIE